MERNHRSLCCARRRIQPIEILIGILLAGYLFALAPAVFQSAREEANRAMCAANLREIGFAILDYEAEHRHLPGPARRMVQSPLVGDARPGATTDRDQWANMNVCMSLLLEDYFGPLGPENPDPFFCRSNEVTFTDTRAPVYLLMRNIRTIPASFFGDADFGRQPLGVHEIIRAGNSLVSREATQLSEIWMIADIDSHNFRSTGAFPAPDHPPVHSGGRNYVFFDGSLDYRTPENWPANSGDQGNDS